MQNEYKTVIHNGCMCEVTPYGKVRTMNGLGEMTDRKWRYNHDGYPVISATGFHDDGNKFYRTIAVHILVAKAWVPNPHNKPEVNHKDFNRANPCFSNLEWVTHQENIQHSFLAGRYTPKYGSDNANYGNRSLSKKYAENKDLSKSKQGRPGARNGRAKRCKLMNEYGVCIGEFGCQRDAVSFLVKTGVIQKPKHPETIIEKMKNGNKLLGMFLLV